MTVSRELRATAPDRPRRELPTLVRTRSGILFDPRADVWLYLDENVKVRINFPLLPPVSEMFLLSLRWVLIRHAEERAPQSLNAAFGKLLRLLRAVTKDRGVAFDELTDIDLLNYKIYRYASGQLGEYTIGPLTGFFAMWHQMGLPGLQARAATLLKETRWASSPTRGDAVRTRCPVRGPLTELEQQAFIQGADNAYAAGAIDEFTYLATWLLNAFGLRPAQLASIKVGDLSTQPFEGGDRRYRVNVPRVKQREQLARESFKERYLVPDIGAPLFDYARRVRDSFAERLVNPEDAPLFPAARSVEAANSPGFLFHATASQLTKRLQNSWIRFNLSSERTGASLDVSPRRLRYTFGTRAAQENCSLGQIAELLDHSDTQSAKVYVASTPEIAVRIDSKVARDLAPLARAFMGHVIQDEAEATRGHDKSSRIVDMRVDARHPVGSCGSCAGCGLVKPLACYTCSSFEPWLDGPHEALLDRLIAERDRLWETTDPRIASVNDRTILAVAYVVDVCKTERERRSLSVA
ncbi:Phage integrase family protein [Burkholderia sp. CF099]|nr:Phage integrase family protein [Burkholderia sp. CF099]